MGAFANYLTRHRSGGGGSLLLDPGVLTASSGGAYSIRLLRTAYAGNCMLVRRSSDNTSQAIGFVGGTLDTATLLTFCGVGNGFVVTWYDQSGSGRDVTQATTTLQPQIVASGVVNFVTGAVPGVLFNQTAPALLANSSPWMTNNAGGISASIVANVSNNTSAGFCGLIWEGASGTAPQYAPIYGVNAQGNELSYTLRNDAGSNIVAAIQLGTPNFFTGSLHTGLVTDSGSSVLAYVDGTVGTADNYTRAGTFTPTSFAIGALNRSTPVQGTNGTMAEIVAFTSVLGSTDRATLQTNQSTFY
jgi:hypothetical protein